MAKAKEDTQNKNVAASSLRMTFKTDRPLFPYREPASKDSAMTRLGANTRLLRIYFLTESQFQGELTKETAWTGKTVWSNKLSPDDRKKVLEMLKLPETTGPANWWLTEFEDDWPYRVAPADVYFSRAADQKAVKREPIIEYVLSPWPADVMVYVLAAVVFAPPLYRRVRRGRKE